MRYAAPILALAILAAPAALAAQAPATSEGENPVERLLSHRSELALTADQIRKLEEIDRRTAAEDAELRAKLAALRGKPTGEPLRMREMNAEQRERVQANRAEIRPLMVELRAIHTRAIADARAVLTTAQNDKAGAYLYPGVGRGRGAGGDPWTRGNGGAARPGSGGPGRGPCGRW